MSPAPKTNPQMFGRLTRLSKTAINDNAVGIEYLKSKSLPGEFFMQSTTNVTKEKSETIDLL